MSTKIEIDCTIHTDYGCGRYKSGQNKNEFSFRFPFTDRESYVAYRADWKERLDAFVKEQREFREAASKMKSEGRGADANAMNCCRRRNRIVAHRLLAERAQAKQEAQRQWELNKTVTA